MNLLLHSKQAALARARAVQQDALVASRSRGSHLQAEIGQHRGRAGRGRARRGRPRAAVSGRHRQLRTPAGPTFGPSRRLGDPVRDRAVRIRRPEPDAQQRRRLGLLPDHARAPGSCSAAPARRRTWPARPSRTRWPAGSGTAAPAPPTGSAPASSASTDAARRPTRITCAAVSRARQSRSGRGHPDRGARAPRGRGAADELRVPPDQRRRLVPRRWPARSPTPATTRSAATRARAPAAPAGRAPTSRPAIPYFLAAGRPGRRPRPTRRGGGRPPRAAISQAVLGTIAVALIGLVALELFGPRGRPDRAGPRRGLPGADRALGGARGREPADRVRSSAAVCAALRVRRAGSAPQRLRLDRRRRGADRAGHAHPRERDRDRRCR